MDYTTHKPGSFRLTPPDDQLAAWQADYQTMLGPMFFGNTPTFAEIMAAATAFETTFNATGRRRVENGESPEVIQRENSIAANSQRNRHRPE